MALNSQQFSDSGVQFSFTPSDDTSSPGLAGTLVSSVWPQGVSVVGGSAVTVAGLNFGLATPYTTCRFQLGAARTESIIVTATVTDPSSIQCVTPAISEAQWKDIAVVHCSNATGYSFPGRLVSLMTIIQHSLRVPVGVKVKNSEIQTCNPLAASCHFTQVWQLPSVPDCC